MWRFPWICQKRCLSVQQNDLSTVPRPLLDRMEIIESSGYTENEKYHIATEHLMQKQMKKHGLDESRFQISEKAMPEDHP